MTAPSAMPRRPKFLNLLAIRLPVPGVVSILHRVSGVALILALPLLTWALAVAVASPAGYTQVAGILDNWFVKLLLLGVIWSSMHHLCAGIRFLLLEMRIGLELAQARAGAYAVLVASVLLTAAMGAWALL